MSASRFSQRGETFGFDSDQPWALPALRLLCHAPRVFTPLVDAWDGAYPGTREALNRLHDLGFVAYQPPVVIDTLAQQPAESATRRVDRYRLTYKGHRLLREAQDNPRSLRQVFRRLTDENIPGVISLLSEFAVDASRCRDGKSLVAFAESGPLPRRTAYYWGTKLCDAGYLRRLPDRAADSREAIPGHWRITRALTLQLRTVFKEFPSTWGHLTAEFRLQRNSYLDDIEIVRVSIHGRTDYDHDVNTQDLAALFLTSGAVNLRAPFHLEPHRRLPVLTDDMPWKFTSDGDGAVYYQPDVMFSAAGPQGAVLSFLEYERAQRHTRGWSHIERLLGYLATHRRPFERAQLLFVVDTERRERPYVDLIEAFADYALRAGDVLPENPVRLAVSSRHRLLDAPSPLARDAWFSIDLPGGTSGVPRLHDVKHSPIHLYLNG